MNKKAVLFNNKKRIKLFVLGLLIVLFDGAMLYISLQSTVIRIAYVLAFAGLLLAGLMLVIVQMRRITSKERLGLALDSNGFDFKGTSIGKAVGKISWCDIEAIQANTAYGRQQLFVKLIKPEPYVDKISNTQIRKLILKEGLPLNADELDIDFHEMETCMMEYYHRYHFTQTNLQIGNG